nr:p21-activated protein kinase-interacting protein 1 isoform X1 [Microcebus murinus]
MCSPSSETVSTANNKAPKRQPYGHDVYFVRRRRKDPPPPPRFCVFLHPVQSSPVGGALQGARAQLHGAGRWLLRAGPFWIHCTPGARGERRPRGTITCLKFYGSRHLISGAEDGLICVWDAKKWECLKSIKAHKGHVTFLSIHPSGKLALSVGTDKTLRTWNLVEGRSAFIKNIKQNAHIVEWSPRGEKYIVVILNKIDIYQLNTASISGTITNEKRISSVTFLSDSVLAVAGDEEAVRFFDCDSLVCLSEFKAHENRVKDIFSFEISEHHVIVTASSDGFIKMWKLKQDKKVPPSLLCEVNTNARLTCLGVWLDKVPDMKASLPSAAEPSPVSEEEQFKISKKESGDTVREEEKQSKPNAKKRGLTANSNKPTKGNSLVSTKKRKLIEKLEKKRKKKKI